MPGAGAKTHSALRITVAEDKLTAMLSIDESQAPLGVDPLELVKELKNSGLVINPEFLREMVGCSAAVRMTEARVVATGRPPVDDQSARIEMLVTASKSPDESSVSYYNQSHIVMATAGQAIARLVPIVTGEDGVDVYGQVIPRRKAGPIPVLGTNVNFDKDLRTIVAEATGTVKHIDNRLWIDTVLEINSNVDFSTGNIEFAGDVIVHGTVIDLFKVKSTGTIRIDKAIEAAEVHAGVDLIAGGGIIGKDKGRCSAGRNVVAKYISNTTVQAGQDIIATNEVANSRLICGGKLTVEHGALLAGQVTARAGVTCKALGSPANVMTLVEVGVDEELRKLCAEKLPEIQAQRKKVQQIRETVGPLMQNQKALTAAQKEKATELLYNASELEEECNRVTAEIQTLHNTVQSHAKGAEIRVQDIIHSGVVIRFPGLEVRVNEPLKGPIRLARRQIDGHWQVAILSVSGHVIPVPARSYVDPATDGLGRVLTAPQEG